jgi:hypothetical protein
MLRNFASDNIFHCCVVQGKHVSYDLAIHPSYFHVIGVVCRLYILLHNMQYQNSSMKIYIKRLFVFMSQLVPKNWDS